jgi:hypothetical protein
MLTAPLFPLGKQTNVRPPELEPPTIITSVTTVLVVEDMSMMARLERERWRQDVSIYGYYPNFAARCADRTAGSSPKPPVIRARRFQSFPPAWQRALVTITAKTCAVVSTK